MILLERDFSNGFMPPFMDYNKPPPPVGMDTNEMTMYYEQCCLYYRYLCLQMDYKIKCKEYEKMNNEHPQNERNNRRIE